MNQNKADNVRQIFSSIAKRYDVCNTILSLGLDYLWRKRAVKMVELSQGARALDLCAGTGSFVPFLSKDSALVVGVDFCAEMLEVAVERCSKFNNFLPIQADALKLPFRDDCFDTITVGFGVRNISDLTSSLGEMARVIKPEGRVAILETGQPKNSFLCFLYKLYHRFYLQLLGGFVSGNKEAYRYFTASSLSFPSGEEFENLLPGTGFKLIKRRALLGGIAYIYVLETEEHHGKRGGMSGAEFEQSNSTLKSS